MWQYRHLTVKHCDQAWLRYGSLVFNGLSKCQHTSLPHKSLLLWLTFLVLRFNSTECPFTLGYHIKFNWKLWYSSLRQQVLWQPSGVSVICWKDRKGQRLKNILSDKLCPTLTLSLMSVPQSSQGTGDLSHRQPAHKQGPRPSVETDTSTTKEHISCLLLSFLPHGAKSSALSVHK